MFPNKHLIKLLQNVINEQVNIFIVSYAQEIFEDDFVMFAQKGCPPNFSGRSRQDRGLSRYAVRAYLRMVQEVKVTAVS